MTGIIQRLGHARLFLLAALLWLGCIPSAFALRAPSASIPVPPENRVGGSDPCASGRLSIEDTQSPGNAMGLEGCDYERASGRRQWLNRDPIGELGGINLNDYVGNDPLDYVDPYGLFNPVKGGVGGINIGRGIYKSIGGGLELAIGVPAMIAGPGTGPLAPLEEAGAALVTAKGAADLMGGIFLCRRDAKQLGEASADPSKGTGEICSGFCPSVHSMTTLESQSPALGTDSRICQFGTR
jgi:RHS repeat-associated protein